MGSPAGRRRVQRATIATWRQVFPCMCSCTMHGMKQSPRRPRRDGACAPNDRWNSFTVVRHGNWRERKSVGPSERKMKCTRIAWKSTGRRYGTISPGTNSPPGYGKRMESRMTRLAQTHGMAATPNGITTACLSLRVAMSADARSRRDVRRSCRWVVITHTRLRCKKNDAVPWPVQRRNLPSKIS
jgi:hypothetical protein